MRKVIFLATTFFIFFVFILPLVRQVFSYSCGSVGVSIPTDKKSEETACNEKYNQCSAEKQKIWDTWWQCAGVKCNAHGRDQKYVNPDTCQQFPGDQSGYCPCVAGCGEKPSGNWGSDCMPVLTECCKALIDNSSESNSSSSNNSGNTNSNKNNEELISLTVSPTSSSVLADGKSNIIIKAQVTGAKDNNSVSLQFVLERPNKINPGMLVGSTSFTDSSAEVTYQSPLISTTQMKGKDENITDTLYVYVSYKGKKQYKTVAININPVEGRQVKGRVLHVNSDPFENVSLEVMLDGKTQFVKTNTQGEYKAVFPEVSIVNGNGYIKFSEPGYINYDKAFTEVLKDEKADRKKITVFEIKDLVLGKKEEYEDEAIKNVTQFVKAANFQEIGNQIKTIKFKYDPSKDIPEYEDKLITLKDEEAWLNFDPEDIYHEFGHAFWMLAQPDSWWANVAIYGRSHDVWVATNKGTAFDESRTHFFANLTLQYLKLNKVKTTLKRGMTDFSYNFPEVTNSKENKDSWYDKNGENIEGILTKFYRDYLGQKCVSQPDQCLNRFNAIHSLFQTSLKNNKPPRDVLELVSGFFVSIWDDKNISTLNKVKEHNFLVKQMNENNIIHDYPLILASTDADFFFSTKNRTGLLIKGTVELIGGRWEYIISADTIIKPHSDFTISISPNKLVGLILHKGSLDILNKEQKTIGLITDTEKPYMVNNSSLTTANNEVLNNLQKNLQGNDLSNYESIQIPDYGYARLFKGNFDIYSAICLLIAFVFLILIIKKIGNRIVFLILIIILVGFVVSRYFSLIEVGSDLRNISLPIPTIITQATKPTIQPSTIASTLIENDPKNNDTSDVVPDSVQYYNCKYNYTFQYAIDWSNTSTKDSDKAVFSGNKIKVTVEAFPKNKTFDEFISEMNKKISATLTTHTKTDRYGGMVTETIFNNPYAVARYWEEQNYFMQLLATNVEDQDDKSNLDSILVTMSVNNDQISYCKDEEECSHPNGDVEFWWKTVSDEEQQCYIKKYGITPSL